MVKKKQFHLLALINGLNNAVKYRCIFQNDKILKNLKKGICFKSELVFIGCFKSTIQSDLILEIILFKKTSKVETI